MVLLIEITVDSEKSLSVFFMVDLTTIMILRRAYLAWDYTKMLSLSKEVVSTSFISCVIFSTFQQPPKRVSKEVELKKTFFTMWEIKAK